VDFTKFSAFIRNIFYCVGYFNNIKALPLLPCTRVQTLILDGVKGSTSLPGHALPPRERTPCAFWIGGWVGLRADVDTDARGESFSSAGDRKRHSVCSQTLY
jgi:hypothetical protein